MRLKTLKLTIKPILIRIFSYIIFSCIYVIKIAVLINGWGLEPIGWTWILGGYFLELLIMLIFDRLITMSNQELIEIIDNYNKKKGGV